MNLYRIFYTFKNADENTSWNDRLYQAEDLTSLLAKFKATSTNFVLGRLVSISLYIVDPRNGKEDFMPETKELVIEFMRVNRAN